MRKSRNQININFKSILTPSQKLTMGIFFAGGGGISQGMKEIDEVTLAWLLNHDKTALRTSAFHNKGVRVIWSDVYVQDEKEMEPVEIVQASLECDEMTGANTKKVKNVASYTMGWEFFRYLKHLNPLVIMIENVPEFKNWAPLDENNIPIKEQKGEEFKRWKKAIMDLGYEYKESIRNAADDGLPTRRVRFFCFFYRPGIDISFPETTHSEKGGNGKKKWLSCREHIDTNDIGPSIFGRKFNKSLKKIQQQPLCPNSLRRIAGGIKKQCPQFYQFLAKYHAGENPERSQSLDSPINTIDTSNRHQLVTVEGLQFIQDHCQTDNYQTLDGPLRTQLTWQTKQLVTLEKLKFIMDHCHSDKHQGLSEPLGVQTTRQTKQLVDIEVDETFITQYYGGSIQSNNLDEPINTIPCRDTHQLVRIEKMQFLAKYFNSNGKPETQTQGLDEPLSTVLGTNKHQLITLLTMLDKLDIRARFLRPDELAACTTFPRDYFSHPELKLSHKSAVELIGNAVPPKWVKKIMKPNIASILQFKETRLSA